MHSSRMRTARSLIVSPYLIVSHACTPPPRATTHAPREQPCMPPRSNHACPLGPTTHTPQKQPCMPPPGATMHTPPWSNHACPPPLPGATMHDPPPPEQLCMPTPSQEQPRMPPRTTMHAPGSNHARPPPVNRQV